MPVLSSADAGGASRRAPAHDGCGMRRGLGAPEYGGSAARDGGSAAGDGGSAADDGGSAAGRGGALSILLHTHMPYVEGFGTWPFGEEWLWEAMATSYLPLLDLLDEGAPLTLSLTPVLCDQLEAPGIAERFTHFVQEVRRFTHDEDAAGLRAGGHEQLARELERAYAADYEHAAQRLAERGGDLLAAFAPHAQWTSSATHAVLPLIASDAGLRAQVQCGIGSHRARFGRGWQGGFWLPECAHVADLEPELLRAGVRSCCVELTGRLSLGSPAHLRPLISEAGLTLVPIDRQTISLVWSEDGYPADGRYRDYHRHTIHHHNPWANDGGAYDHEQALALAREHAADFVAAVRARLRGASPGLLVCALDTELLGHWWYEGIAWLAEVVAQCAAQGVELLRLDEALGRFEPQPARIDLREPSSWGRGGDLSTWSGPPVAEIAFAQRDAELELLRSPAPSDLALRQLMATQSSDWAFMVSRGQASIYARERFEGHIRAFEQALAAGADADPAPLRNLAVHADAGLLARS